MSQSLSVASGNRRFILPISILDPWRANGIKRQPGGRLKKTRLSLRELAYQLYAENRRAVLLVLQGMDTAGKDGTIRVVMSGINPQSCLVVSFKEPSHEELDHDFLWRIHKAIPRRGNIGIFNRSHYEDVLDRASAQPGARIGVEHALRPH